MPPSHGSVTFEVIFQHVPGGCCEKSFEAPDYETGKTLEFPIYFHIWWENDMNIYMNRYIWKCYEHLIFPWIFRFSHGFSYLQLWKRSGEEAHLRPGMFSLVPMGRNANRRPSIFSFKGSKRRIINSSGSNDEWYGWLMILIYFKSW